MDTYEKKYKESLALMVDCTPDEDGYVHVRPQDIFPELRELDDEGSEEDEHRIKDTIYFLETAKKHYASTVELDACINRLKSIKERYTWKPSEEQIVVLELASKYERVFTPKQIDILIGLKEQLKKLKG